MKKFYITIVMIQMIFGYAMFAQVYTPIGSSVEYNSYSAGNVALFENEAATYLSNRGWTTSVTKTGNATGAYNCHSYAWYMSEGGSNNYWINAFLISDLSSFNNYSSSSTPPAPNNINKYWNDGSYAEVTEGQATKVWFGSCWQWNSTEGRWNNSCDHSAVRLSTGLYESKWGSWPRYRHPADKCPYTLSNRKFFKKNTPSITGPATLCSGSGSFTVSNPPAGYSWNKSSNLTLSSTSGNTATFTMNASGPAWVSVVVNGTEVKRKTLYAGVPQTAAFSGSCGGPETGSTGLFTGSASPASSSYGIDAFEWSAYPGWTIISHPNFPSSITMGNVRITRTSSSAYTTTPVWVRAHNSCGWSDEKQVGTLSSSSYYSMSAGPNPVSDVLSVLIEEDAAALALFETAGSTVSGAGTAARAKPVYTIRLYSIMGGAPALQISANEAGTVQLNVSSLPGGIYVLHVHDGTENPPLTQRIVISH
jgi:hypothetical protein